MSSPTTTAAANDPELTIDLSQLDESLQDLSSPDLAPEETLKYGLAEYYKAYTHWEIGGTKMKPSLRAFAARHCIPHATFTRHWNGIHRAYKEAHTDVQCLTSAEEESLVFYVKQLKS